MNQTLLHTQSRVPASSAAASFTMYLRIISTRRLFRIRASPLAFIVLYAIDPRRSDPLQLKLSIA